MVTGTHKVVIKYLPFIWERITQRGTVGFDYYNYELSPNKTLVVSEIHPNQKVHFIPNILMSSSCVIN